MPINTCSINRQTINGRCGKIFAPPIIPSDKGHVRNLPPAYNYMRRENEVIEFADIEQQFITISIELCGDVESITYENMPLELSQIAYINDFNINASPIIIDIVDLKLEKVNND